MASASSRPASDASSSALPPTILVSDLTKRYSNAVLALDGVSLEIPAGEFFGLFGPNGAGKSTLLKILTGQIGPTSGRAWVLGLDPTDEPLAVRAAVGIVPEAESPPSFLTVEEVLEFVARLRGVGGVGKGVMDTNDGTEKRGNGDGTGGTRYQWESEGSGRGGRFLLRSGKSGYTGGSEAANEEVSALVAPWIEYFGLDDKAQTQCRHLSRGQRQKVMLAAAFLHRPPLLFLDEPFINLDPLIQRKLRSWLRAYILDGGTVVMATHILEVAERLCTQVAIIDAGKVVASSTKADLAAAGRGLEQAFYEAVGYPLSEEEA